MSLFGRMKKILALAPTIAANRRIIDIDWPQGRNIRLSVPDFGDEVLAIRFRTPASSDRQPSIQVSQLPGAPQVFRVATLATGPGLMAISGTSAAVLASSLSQTPVFRLQVGGVSRLALTALNPGTTYYLNVANRDGYDRACNCHHGRCGVYIDFTN